MSRASTASSTREEHNVPHGFILPEIPVRYLTGITCIHFQEYQWDGARVKQVTIASITRDVSHGIADSQISVIESLGVFVASNTHALSGSQNIQYPRASTPAYLPAPVHFDRPGTRIKFYLCQNFWEHFIPDSRLSTPLSRSWLVKCPFPRIFFLPILAQHWQDYVSRLWTVESLAHCNFVFLNNLLIYHRSHEIEAQPADDVPCSAMRRCGNRDRMIDYCVSLSAARVACFDNQSRKNFIKPPKCPMTFFEVYAAEVELQADTTDNCNYKV